MEGGRWRDGSRGCTCIGEGGVMSLEDAPAGEKVEGWV